jgi:hypothetical protein
MKKVFSNYREVMHVYAQRTQSEARCGNVYFEGNDIYSYGRHYCLASFLDANTIWINDRGYSVTTSKHISHIIGATRQYKQFFYRYTDINHVYSEICNLRDKLGKARKPEMYANDIIFMYEKHLEWIQYKNPIYYESEQKKFDEITVIYNNVNDPKYQELLRIAQIERAKLEKQRKAKQLAENLQKFFAYEISSFNNDEDYLRISKNGEFVETSQHVQVSIAEAKLLYQMILAGKDIKGHKIGYYTIISINGVLKIGCHNINIDNMHEIGQKLLNL